MIRNRPQYNKEITYNMTIHIGPTKRKRERERERGRERESEKETFETRETGREVGERDRNDSNLSIVKL